MKFYKSLILASLFILMSSNTVLANTEYSEIVYNRLKPIKVNNAKEVDSILELYDAAISEVEILKLRSRIEDKNTLLDQLQYKLDVCRQLAYMKAKIDFISMNSNLLPSQVVNLATQEADFADLVGKNNTDCRALMLSYMAEVRKKR